MDHPQPALEGHIANGFKLELILHTLSKGRDPEVYISFNTVIHSHVTQYSVSLCEMETTESEICSISDI